MWGEEDTPNPWEEDPEPYAPGSPENPLPPGDPGNWNEQDPFWGDSWPESAPVAPTAASGDPLAPPLPPPVVFPQQSSSGGGGGSSASQFPAPSVPRVRPSPNPLRPWEENFQAPTMEDALNNPGFKFRLGEGLKAIERSAAAKGTLLTGGTMKGLQNYGQESASQEYGNVYNRNRSEYEGRRTNFLTNEANRYQSERANLNDQWGMESDQFGMNRTNRMDDFGIDTGFWERGRADRLDEANQQNMTFAQLLGLANLTRPPSPYGFD